MDIQASESGAAGTTPARWRSERFRRNTFLVSCIALVLVKVWLALAFGMRAAGNAEADDRLFVVLAEHLVRGDWLGEYGRHTLVKGPFYSMWIAAVFMAHIPLGLSYQLLHAAACALFIVAVRPWVRSRLPQFVLFALLLFDPSMFSIVASWVVRDSIYSSLTIIVWACIVALLARLDQPPRRLLGWSLGLGFMLAAYWCTREEGVWILPAAGIALLYALVHVWRTRQQAFAKIALLVLPAVICVAGVLGVCAMNYKHYGLFTVVDIKAPNFLRANGALMRVHHEHWNQFAAVPKEVRMKIYPVSPAFAELQGFLDGPPGEAWGAGAEQFLVGGTPSPTDIRGGFFMWALRQAVQERGSYRDAVETEAFYGRIADEVNAACSDGRLKCGRERASLSLPFRREYISLGAESYWKALRLMVEWGDIKVFNMPSSGPEDRMVIFEDMTRTRINQLMGDTSEPRLKNQALLDQARFAMINKVMAAYRAVSPYVTITALATFLLICILEFRARALSPMLVVLVALLALIFVRLALLVVINITSFDAMRVRYFLPVYPLLLLFWFLSISHATGLVWTKIRRQSAAPETIA